MKINNKGYAITLIVFGILIVFIVVLSTLLITMNNSVKLNKTVKESIVESIQLGEDTSGTSFIDRIEQLESKLSDIKGNIIDTIYPVGSVYITATDATVGAVEDRFPGTYWQEYAQGRTLIGEGTGTDKNGNAQIFTNNSEGGEYIHTLTTNEMPSHTHSIPSLSGTASSTGNGYSIGYGSSTRTTSSDGSHQHNIIMDMWGTTLLQGAFIINSTLSENPGFAPANGTIQGQRAGTTWTTLSGSHTHTYPDYYANSISGVEAHTHNVTTSTGNTGSVGSGSSFNMQNPYITVYMYKRVE